MAAFALPSLDGWHPSSNTSSHTTELFTLVMITLAKTPESDSECLTTEIPSVTAGCSLFVTRCDAKFVQNQHTSRDVLIMWDPGCVRRLGRQRKLCNVGKYSLENYGKATTEQPKEWACNVQCAMRTTTRVMFPLPQLTGIFNALSLCNEAPQMFGMCFRRYHGNAREPNVFFVFALRICDSAWTYDQKSFPKLNFKKNFKLNHRSVAFVASFCHLIF